MDIDVYKDSSQPSHHARLEPLREKVTVRYVLFFPKRAWDDRLYVCQMV
jgi:hypothetical protein